ncbi:hypothetical protein SAMN02990966_05996 [Rhodospirillales bacterium URHD0017]|nr:hypothetical protein SAMN02990966_05996 [Rhodospirillales bacterium URHD0017]
MVAASATSLAACGQLSGCGADRKRRESRSLVHLGPIQSGVATGALSRTRGAHLGRRRCWLLAAPYRGVGRSIRGLTFVAIWGAQRGLRQCMTPTASNGRGKRGISKSNRPYPLSRCGGRVEWYINRPTWRPGLFLGRRIQNCDSREGCPRCVPYRLHTGRAGQCEGQCRSTVNRCVPASVISKVPLMLILASPMRTRNSLWASSTSSGRPRHK